MNTNKERREEAFSTLEKELKKRNRVEKARPLGVVVATVVILVAVAGGIYWAATSGGDDHDNTAASADTTTTEQQKNKDLPAVKADYGDSVTCDYTKADQPDSKQADLPQSDNVPAKGTVNVTLHTNQGDIPVTMDRSKSPCTVNAIESLAKQGFYDDTVCHRLTTEGIFVRQCGDPSGTGKGGPGFTFKDEYPSNSVSDSDKEGTFNYKRGTLAMANSGEDTNGSQFFLVYKDSPLPPKYNVFGSISDDGLKTIDGIADKGAKPQDESGNTAPNEEVKITSAAVS